MAREASKPVKSSKRPASGPGKDAKRPKSSHAGGHSDRKSAPAKPSLPSKPQSRSVWKTGDALRMRNIEGSLPSARNICNTSQPLDSILNPSTTPARSARKPCASASPRSSVILTSFRCLVGCCDRLAAVEEALRMEKHALSSPSTAAAVTPSRHPTALTRPPPARMLLPSGRSCAGTT